MKFNCRICGEPIDHDYGVAPKIQPKCRNCFLDGLKVQREAAEDAEENNADENRTEPAESSSA